MPKDVLMQKIYLQTHRANTQSRCPKRASRFDLLIDKEDNLNKTERDDSDTPGRQSSDCSKHGTCKLARDQVDAARQVSKNSLKTIANAAKSILLESRLQKNKNFCL